MILGLPLGLSQGFKRSKRASLAGAPSWSLHKCQNKLSLRLLIFSDHFLHSNKEKTSSFVILANHLMFKMLLMNGCWIISIIISIWSAIYMMFYLTHRSSTSFVLRWCWRFWQNLRPTRISHREEYATSWLVAPPDVNTCKKDDKQKTVFILHHYRKTDVFCISSVYIWLYGTTYR